MIDGYRKFLEGGCTKPPVELLKLCGVDLSSPQPVKEALAVFEDLLKRFEAE